MRKSVEGGFTLIEVLISSLILLPILFAIITTQQVVGTTMSANERRSDASDQLRKVARRLRQILRPGVLSTSQTRAIQYDIDSATAKEAQRVILDPLGTPIPIPAMGQWISPIDLQSRLSVQFQCASGELSVNSLALTAPRFLEWKMDTNETDNDLDDDGDGVVDEGKMFYQYDGSSFVLADNIESCGFTFDQGALILTLSAARVDSRRRVHRASLVQRIYMRNN